MLKTDIINQIERFLLIAYPESKTLNVGNLFFCLENKEIVLNYHCDGENYNKKIPL